MLNNSNLKKNEDVVSCCPRTTCFRGKRTLTRRSANGEIFTNRLQIMFVYSELVFIKPINHRQESLRSEE